MRGLTKCLVCRGAFNFYQYFRFWVKKNIGDHALVDDEVEVGQSLNRALLMVDMSPTMGFPLSLSLSLTECWLIASHFS